MSEPLSRRGFTKGVVAASVASSLAGGLLWTKDRLTSAEGAAAMVDLVVDALSLADRQRGAVQEFVQALQAGALAQIETADHLEALIQRGAASHADLQRYLVEEFVVSTNYLEYATGQTADLALLPKTSRSLPAGGVGSA